MPIIALYRIAKFYPFQPDFQLCLLVKSTPRPSPSAIHPARQNRKVTPHPSPVIAIEIEAGPGMACSFRESKHRSSIDSKARFPVENKTLRNIATMATIAIYIQFPQGRKLVASVLQGIALSQSRSKNKKVSPSRLE